MEYKRSVVAQTIGGICLFIGLFLGVSLLVYGLFITISAVILSATGYDATGLGIIIGPPMIVAGIVFSCPLILAVRLLNLRPKHLVLSASIIALIPLIFGMIGTISWKSKIDIERKHEEALAKTRDEVILDKFENSKAVVVKVICKIRQNIQENDIEAIQASRRKFALENIIQPLGPQNISNYKFYKWGDYDVYFIAEVTRDGYESLKQNMHVSIIELYKRK